MAYQDIREPTERRLVEGLTCPFHCPEFRFTVILVEGVTHAVVGEGRFEVRGITSHLVPHATVNPPGVKVIIRCVYAPCVHVCKYVSKYVCKYVCMYVSM